MRSTDRLCWRVVLGSLGTAGALFGQEKPLTVGATVTTGYYSTMNRGEANQSTSFAPLGARFQVGGFCMSPEILSFSAQPELNLGPQASDAGFQGGNGIKLNFTLLRNSITPLTFHYSNLQVQDVYFGGLTQLSGYTLKERNRDLGLTWEFKPHHMPTTTVDWGRTSVTSASSVVGVSDYVSSGSHLNVDTKYEVAGFDLHGFLRKSRQDSDLLSPFEGGVQTGALKENVTQYQGSVRHPLPFDSEVYVEGGSQAMSSMLLTLPIDLNTRYANANLRLTQKSRWKTLLRAGYSSNLGSQLLERAAGALNTPGAALADGNVLAPFTHGIESWNVNVVSTYTLGHGLGVYGSMERSAIQSSNQDGGLNSDYFTSSAGLTYTGKYHWGNVSGEYGRELGSGSLIGQSGSIRGQRYVATVQHGDPSGAQFDLTIHGSNETVVSTQPLTNSSFSAEGSFAHPVASSLNVRAGGGWQRGLIVNSANEFRTGGFTARLGLEHPRFQAGVSLNNTLSDSLPFYDQAFEGLGVGSVLATALRPIPSDYRAETFTLHAYPMHKVEVSGSWTRSNQHLDKVLTNNFEILNVYLTYHYRKIQIEAGLIRSNQVFSFYPDTLRRRYYVRVVRSARLL